MHAEQPFLVFCILQSQMVKKFENHNFLVLNTQKFRFKGTFKASPSRIKQSIQRSIIIKVLIYFNLGAMFASVSFVSTSF